MNFNTRNNRLLEKLRYTEDFVKFIERINEIIFFSSNILYNKREERKYWQTTNDNYRMSLDDRKERGIVWTDGLHLGLRRLRLTSHDRWFSHVTVRFSANLIVKSDPKTELLLSFIQIFWRSFQCRVWQLWHILVIRPVQGSFS